MIRSYLRIATFAVLLLLASCSNNGAHNHNPVPDVTEENNAVDSAMARPEESAAPTPESASPEAKDQPSANATTAGEKNAPADTKDKAH